MDFFSRSMAQLRDLFASMTPAARITSTLLLGVIVVSLGYLFQGYSSGSKEVLFNGEALQPGEAHRIESVIAKAKLTGWERQGDRILVPRGEKAEYLAAIADANALPANFDTLLEESLDLGGAFVSEPTRKARMKAVRERQLSMIVRRMDGVEEAQVLYDIREAKGFGKEQTTATASVRPQAGQTLTPARQKTIREAVAGAIAGMSPQDVMILDLSNGSQYAAGGDGSAEAFDDPYFQTRIQYERMMENRIVDLLRDIHGVKVKVTAELDPTLGSEIRSHKSEGDPQQIRFTQGEESTTETDTEDRGQVGLEANGPGRKSAEQAVAKNETSHTNNQSTTDNFVPTIEEVRQTAALVPQQVRAAVAIPSDFLVQVWRVRNPDKTAEEAPAKTDLDELTDEYKRNIENLVSPLFPRKLAEDPYPNVSVAVFQSLKPDELPPPTMMSESLMWAGRNSGSLIMAGLAVVSLTMLRSLVKSIPPAETNVILSPPMAAAAASTHATIAMPTMAQEPHHAAEPGEAPAEPRKKPSADKSGRPRLRLKKGVSMKDDLTDIVREDPDAAAAILRSWIGNAG
jgi:flagellar M-ring protein FliF